MKFNQTPIFHSLLLLTLLLVSVRCDNANNTDSPKDKYFLKYYGEDGDQQAVDMVVNNDGTFLLLGSSTGGTQTILIIKADAEGNILWQKKFGTSTDIPKDIEPTLDGNYVVLSDFQKSANNMDVKLIRITSDGNKMDSVITGTEQSGNFYSDHSKSVTPVSDGGFIVTGSTDFDRDPSDLLDATSSFFHFRFDQNFIPFNENQWENYYTAGRTNVAVKTFQKGDKFYVFGYCDKNLNGKSLLIYYSLNEVASNGEPEYLGDPNENTEADFLLKVPDALIEGYMIISTSNKDTIIPKLRISKLKDPLQFIISDDKQFDFNVFGGKRLEGVYAAPSIANTIGYLIVSNETKETGETDIMLSKVNQSGEELWAVNFGSENNDRAAAVAELPDGKIIVFCTIETIVQTKMALLKLNSKGQLLN